MQDWKTKRNRGQGDQRSVTIRRAERSKVAGWWPLREGATRRDRVRHHASADFPICCPVGLAKPFSRRITFGNRREEMAPVECDGRWIAPCLRRDDRSSGGRSCYENISLARPAAMQLERTVTFHDLQFFRGNSVLKTQPSELPLLCPLQPLDHRYEAMSKSRICR